MLLQEAAATAEDLLCAEACSWHGAIEGQPRERQICSRANNCVSLVQVRHLSAWSAVPGGARQGLQLVCLCNKPSVEFLALQVGTPAQRRAYQLPLSTHSPQTAAGT